MVAPKVSVCMVTYNHEPYIAQAVESALAQQTAFPIEIVIGEDGSTDATPDILRRFARQHPDTIRLRLAERNQGAKANFMGTLADCRGQYVAMLEGDDYWTSPNKLQIQVDALNAHPEWAICFHPAKCEYEPGMHGHAIYPSNWTKPVATIEDLFEANIIATNSVVFRHRLFPALPAWFRDLKLGDWPLHILNAAHGDIGYLPPAMSAYRIHRGGIWSGETQAARMVAIFQMFTAIDHHFAGEYAAAIDGYRLNALRGIMAEVNAVKIGMAGVLSELRTKSAETNYIVNTNPHSLTIQHYWNQLSTELTQLENKYETLLEEHRKVTAFRDAWCKSIPYRVVRETMRPFKKFWRMMRRHEGLPAESQRKVTASMNEAA